MSVCRAVAHLASPPPRNGVRRRLIAAGAHRRRQQRYRGTLTRRCLSPIGSEALGVRAHRIRALVGGPFSPIQPSSWPSAPCQATPENAWASHFYWLAPTPALPFGWGLSSVASDLIDPNSKDRYRWDYLELEDRQGLPGQNNVNPASVFEQHIFVQVELPGSGVTKWLDPSYGVEYVGASHESRLSDFEDNYLDYFAVLGDANVNEAAIGIDLDGNGVNTDTVKRLVLLARPNDPSTRGVRTDSEDF